ncbi:GGDEF domain-containing protein [Petroclostridium sp. X23]|uniref:GGDEF domain-containing protein n=1 Tax=Petroclostridium sp. X23 TaxID=3045146 RepID=UPI0024AE6150|nr:GGDEF domain-containing protein [Petroclostridium sp. X23]WHH58135.1 GGDEF domain-containing protein [Petroclostridium sp. X23]
MRDNTSNLQNRIFKIIVITGVVLSIVCIIENILVGFPFEMNIKWFFIGIISLIAVRFKQPILSNDYFRLFYALCIILVLVPNGWINSGGSNSSVIAYVFLVMICITFLFQEKTRAILMILLMFTFTILFCLEYFYPQIIKVHGAKAQFLDRLVQMPLTLIGGYLLLRQFADAYTQEKEKLDIYSKELQKANNKLEFMANRDSLTEVYNRRAFDLKLEEIIRDNKHLDKDIYIILFDIDFFKSINDTYGHSMGDQVICRVAKSAAEIASEAGFISRWGGDEFAIIFSGSIEEVKKYMDNLNGKINDIKINEDQIVTISAGITQVGKNDVIKEIFKKVDDGLYRAKDQGRNQYVIM